MKPLIGISCCVKQFGAMGMLNHAASNTYVRATDHLVGGVPVLVPANGAMADIATLVARLDGLILTGSRSNVAPTNYDGPPHAEGTPEDHERDGVTLPLIRATIAAGVPVLAICRGMQELNRQLKARWPVELHVRIGIHTGLVIAGATSRKRWTSPTKAWRWRRKLRRDSSSPSCCACRPSTWSG